MIMISFGFGLLICLMVLASVVKQGLEGRVIPE